MYALSSDLSRMRTMRTLDRGRAHGRPTAFHPGDDSPPTSAAQQRTDDTQIRIQSQVWIQKTKDDGRCYAMLIRACPLQRPLRACLLPLTRVLWGWVRKIRVYNNGVCTCGL